MLKSANNWRGLLGLMVLLLIFSCGGDDDGIDEPSGPQITEEGAFEDDWTYEVFPTVSDNFVRAKFRLWVPDIPEEPRAILILGTSYNGSSLGLVHSDVWQEYANQEKLVLLTFYLKSDDTGGYYANASGGSGAALLKALKAITDKHNLPNVNDLPFLSRGYSAGGSFSYNMSEFLPDRVVAYANIRGSILSTVVTNKDVPGLMIMGEFDNDTGIKNVINTVIYHRQVGGVICFALEPNVDHFGGLNNADKLIRQFFSFALEKRLSGTSSQLNVIPESSGWLGENNVYEYFLFDEYTAEKDFASWLINEEFAESWQKFQTN